MKPMRYTLEATLRQAGRNLDPAWIEAAVRSPDWTTPDPEPPKERRYRAIPELGGKVLRVVCVEEDDHVRIVTVFPDRDARRPDAPRDDLRP